MTTPRVFPSAHRRRPPRLFLLGCLSNYIEGGPGHSLKDWFEVYGRSWRTWWRWVVEMGIMPYDDKWPLIDREWHQENQKREMCHRYRGDDYHYCTPGDRCDEWSKREHERTLPSKALLGWGSQARKLGGSRDR